MRMILKYTLSNIRSNKFVALIIVLSLVVSTAVMSLTLIAKDEVNIRYDRLNRETYQGYDLMITKTDEEPFIELSRLALRDDERKSALPMTVIFGKIKKGERVTGVALWGADPADFEAAGLFQVDGRVNFEDYYGTDKVVLGSQFAKKRGYKEGDAFTVNTAFGEKTFTVGLIAERKGIYYSDVNENKVLVSEATMEDITGISNKNNVVLIKASDKEDIDGEIERIEEENIGISATPLLDMEMINHNKNLMNQVLMMMLILSIFINIYVISSNTKRVLASRMPVIGTFRSIGMSRGKTHAIVFMENIIYGIVGGSLGAVLALLMVDTMISAFASDVADVSGQGAGGASLYYPVLSIFFAIILQVVSVYGVLVKRTRVTIKSLIMDDPVMVKERKLGWLILWVVVFLIAIALFHFNNKDSLIVATVSLVLGMAGMLNIIPYASTAVVTILKGLSPADRLPVWRFSLDNIKKSKAAGESIKLVATASCIVLMIYILSMAIGGLFVQIGNEFTPDYQVRGMTSPASSYDFLGEIEGVKEMKPRFLTFADVTHDEDVHEGVVVTGSDEEELGVTCIEGNLENLRSDEIMVDETYIRKYGWEIGDILELHRTMGEKESTSYTIVGTVDSQLFSVNRTLMVISSASFKENFSRVPYYLYFYMDDRQVDIESKIHEEISGEDLMVQSFQSFMNQQERQISGIMSAVWLIIVLSIVLSLVGVINSQMIGFLQRKRQLAVLYSVAMNKKQLKKTIAVEVITTFLIATVFGMIWAALMVQFLNKFINGMGLYLEAEIPWMQSGLLMGGVFLCLLLTMIMPIRQIEKMNIANQIRYE